MTTVKNRNGRAAPTPGRPDAPVGRARQRALAIGVLETGEDLGELEELLRTAGVATVGQMVQHREQAHPNTYFGPGKLEELKEAIRAQDANVVACDDELSPRQGRNLEEALGTPVVDRTAIILDIFAGHANSAEGKLQVELAQLEYNLARMRGLWTHLERLGAGAGGPAGGPGIGTRGPGESQIETDRRLARDRITALRRRLERVKGARRTMRAERTRAQLPEVALVGYTNAGKSTLLNALTEGDAVAADQLFATLDPISRRLRFPREREVIITDTVGFIRDLPEELVAAFRATLEEMADADLLVHVVDAADADRDAQIRAVEGILADLGLGEKPRVLVWNKADRLEPPDAESLARHGFVASALDRATLGPLLLGIERELWARGVAAPVARSS